MARAHRWEDLSSCDFGLSRNLITPLEAMCRARHDFRWLVWCGRRISLPIVGDVRDDRVVDSQALGKNNVCMKLTMRIPSRRPEWLPIT